MDPKVLLLVNSSPTGTGVGELFLREIGRSLTPNELVRFSTVQRAGEDGEWLGHKSLESRLPVYNIPILATIGYEWFERTQLHGLVEKIIAVIEREKIDVIWAVLSSAQLISLVSSLIKRVRVGAVVTVLDDPDYLMRNQKLDARSRHLVMQQFGDVLRRAVRTSVIGEGMQTMYRAEFGVDPLIMRVGVPAHAIRPWRSHKRSPEKFRIGFAGSLYAKKEWNALLEAVSHSNGRIGNKEVEINFIGHFPRSGASRGANLKDLGRMSQEDALRAMADVDVAYLPYWFDKSHIRVCKTSFPGKLSAYAAAGVPIFYHAPSYASAHAFFQQYPFAVCCNSLDSVNICESLERVVSDREFDCNAAEARAAALEEELSTDVMLRKFKQLIQDPGVALNGKPL